MILSRWCGHPAPLFSSESSLTLENIIVVNRIPGNLPRFKDVLLFDAPPRTGVCFPALYDTRPLRPKRELTGFYLFLPCREPSIDLIQKGECMKRLSLQSCQTTLDHRPTSESTWEASKQPRLPHINEGPNQRLYMHGLTTKRRLNVPGL